MSTTTRALLLLLTSILLVFTFFCLASNPQRSPLIHSNSLSKLLAFLEGKRTDYVQTQKLDQGFEGKQSHFVQTQNSDQEVEESEDLCEKEAPHPQTFDEKDVVELTAKNISQFLMDKNNQYVMVQFYAPWCFFSERLRPAYAAAATKLKGKAVLAKVDASEEAKLRDEYRILGYPTMDFFVNGVRLGRYYDDRSEDDIVSFVKGKMCCRIYNVTTIGEAERILAAKSVIVLAFVDPLEDTYTEELAAASKWHTDVDFYRTTCGNVAKMFQIDPQIKRPALVVLNMESGIHNHLDGQFNSKAIAEFVSSSKSTFENIFILEQASKVLQESAITVFRKDFRGELSA